MPSTADTGWSVMMIAYGSPADLALATAVEASGPLEQVFAHIPRDAVQHLYH